jgi:hypothetical protein
VVTQVVGQFPLRGFVVSVFTGVHETEDLEVVTDDSKEKRAG